MDYIFIGFGHTESFQAESNSEAIQIARRIASDQRLIAWLLYNRAAELIAYE